MMDTQVNKQLSSAEKRKLAIRCTLIGSVFDLLLGIGKIIIGFFYNSHALINDGIHSFSDLFTDGFVIIIAKISNEGPDENHPYGHGKFETIGSVAIGAIIFIVGVLLAIDSISLIISPSLEIVKPGPIALIIAALSIVFKEGIFQYTKIVANKIDSPMLMANAWHSRSDALSSIIVFIGLILSLLGFNTADSVVAIIVSFFIGKVGLDFVFKGFSDLVDTSVPKEKIDFFKKELLKNPSIEDVHNFRSRYINHQMFFDVNIVVSSFISVSEGHEISNWAIHKLKQLDPKVIDVTIHIDVEHDHPTDENGQLIPIKPLPLKNELFSLIKNELGENLFSKIHHFNLHYINRKILIDVYIKSDNIQYKSLIHDQLNKLSLISKITYYAMLEN